MLQLHESLYVVAGPRTGHPWDNPGYLLLGTKPILIDCGSSFGYLSLKTQLEQVNLTPADIHAVLASHGHWGNLSAMASLRQDSDAVLYIHPADRDAVEHGDYHRTGGFHHRQAFPPVTADHLLREGDVVNFGEHCITVIHTPGHTPGSVSFSIEMDHTKILLLGDTLGGEYHRKYPSSLSDWKRSLERLSHLDVDVMTYGSDCDYLVEQPREKLQEAANRFAVCFDPWRPLVLKTEL